MGVHGRVWSVVVDDAGGSDAGECTPGRQDDGRLYGSGGGHLARPAFLQCCPVAGDDGQAKKEQRLG